MDPTDIGLFHLAERRLAWTDQRLGMLAQNVANANTPGFKARDIAPFASALTTASLSRTEAAHLLPPGRAADLVAGRQGAGAPDGNAVSIEEQLSKVADTASIQALVLNLHRSYQGMVRTALGRGG